MRALFGRKVANLTELKEMTELAIRRGQQGHPYTVVREITLSDAEFTQLASDFFADQPWLTREDGGSTPQGEIRCIRVVNQETGEKILVNNEGYLWPRYVSLELP